MERISVAPQFSAIQLGVIALSTLMIVNAIRRFIRDRIERKGYPLPPGPTPLPLLGSALSISAQEPWLTYTAWREKYGRCDVMYAKLLDSDVIVLNSYSDAIELLDKRSRIYSDRPFIATLEPYGHGGNIGFARYGPHWRLARRIIHQTFRAEAAFAFRPMQLRRARQMVLNIIDNPGEFSFHFAMFGAAVATSTIYDYEPKPRDDPIVTLVNDFCEASISSLTPEMAVLLKAFPFLLSVPKWIPGLSRVRCSADKAHALGIKTVEEPYQWVRKRMEAKEDIVADSMVFDHIQRMEKLDGPYRAEYEKALKDSTMTVFTAGAETTASTLMCGTLAMVKNPRIWKRAQAEIDTIIGTDRLPEYEDRPSLPYVEAIIRETFRWRPIAPMSVPHAVTTNDIYKGYFIPRGATIFANVWAMTRDETRYPDPEAFMPERFLNSDGTLNKDDPTELVFGFGRRICAGRHIADASVWSSIATLLSTMDFNPSKDENGNVFEFEAEFVGGLTHHPLPFPCNLVPRAHITREFLQRFLDK